MALTATAIKPENTGDKKETQGKYYKHGTMKE